jgi:hypothetical protein
MQAAFAVSVLPNTIQKVDTHKIFERALANYNTFAANPSINLLPKNLSDTNKKAAEDFVNKIKKPLPKAQMTKSGAIEFISPDGKNVTIEVDPIRGTLRVDDAVLILKSTDSLKNRIEQIQKFLEKPKTAGVFEKVLSVIIPSAEADCLGKYDQAIDDQTPKYKWYQEHPETLIFGIIILAGLFLPAAVANFIAGATALSFVGLTIAANTVYADDIARQEVELKKKDEALAELVSIRGAIAVAKTGDVPPMPAPDMKRVLTDDDRRFFHVYYKYWDEVKKLGGSPISKEDFLKAINEANNADKFCSPTVSDTIEKLTAKIYTQQVIDPNVVNKSEAPAAAVVDKSREDIPKDVIPVTVEQKSEVGVIK